MSEKLMIEGGQNPYPMQALETTDGKVFDNTADVELFSGFEGFEPEVLPNGVLTGGKVTASGSTSVAVSKCSANHEGSVIEVQAATLATTAPGSGVVVNSVIINGDGEYEIIVGTDGSTFSETRGAAGGPAYIPVDAIEVAQVRLVSSTVLDTAIFATPGLHREIASFPSFKVMNIGGYVQFVTELAPIHTGDKPKSVYAKFAEPVLVDVEKASNFKPSENSISMSSEEHYGGTSASMSYSLSGASFDAILKSGISDMLVGLVGKSVYVCFYPDEYKSEHILEQGYLGMSRTFDANKSPKASFTLAVEQEGKNVE